MAGENHRHLDSQSPAAPAGVDRYEHYFYNDQWQLLEMRDTTTVSDQPENLAVDQQFVWSARYIDALILRDRDADGSGGLEERFYFLNDANMNVTCLVDTNGDAVERYQYDPYGALTFLAGDFASRSASSYAVCNTYTGREYDPESGLYGYRHRTYDSNLGRFTSRDPIGYEGSAWSLYEYASGRPIVLIDPSGTAVIAACGVGAAVGGIGGAIGGLIGNFSWTGCKCGGFGGAIQGCCTSGWCTAAPAYCTLGACICGALGSLAQQLCEGSFDYKDPCAWGALFAGGGLGCAGGLAQAAKEKLVVFLTGLDMAAITALCAKWGPAFK